MTETVEARLAPTMGHIACYDATGIKECGLRFRKRNAVLPPVLRILGGVPCKARAQQPLLAHVWAFCHMSIWLAIRRRPNDLTPPAVTAMPQTVMPQRHQLDDVRARAPTRVTLDSPESHPRP